GAGRDWRLTWRADGLLRVQRLPDIDDELSDVQPGGICVQGDADAADSGTQLRTDDGTRRGTDAGHQGSAAADCHGVAATLTTRALETQRHRARKFSLRL